jgi:hypothetical protein
VRPASFRLLLVVLLVPWATPARAQMVALETEDLRLIYLSPLQSYLAPHVARCFEASQRFHRNLFQYTPSEKVTVLLNDFSDFGNAGARAVPRDFVTVDIAPLSFAYETVTANERMNMLMNHELVHVASMDESAGSDRFFRGLFRGKVMPISPHPETILYGYLTAPRASAPRWYIEGIAVFLDTWMAGGVGRAQGAYDEMVFRAMVRDGSRFYDPLGLVSEGTKVDFKVEATSYLYGTRFMSYLARRYSPESLVRWTSRGHGSKAYYASQFKEVFGLPLAQAWREWTLSEHQFQTANLEAIRQYPTTPYEDLSTQAFGAVSRGYVDSDRQELYAAFNYPGVVSHVGAVSLRDGSVRKIVDVKEPEHYTVTSLAYDSGSKTLFYTSDNTEHRDLRSVDPKTRVSKTLMKDARVGELVFDGTSGSLWGIRPFNGISTLVRIPPPYDEWRQVYSWPYGDVVYDLDVSPDGQLVSASVGEISGRQGLRVMKVESLLAGEATPIARFDFGTAIPSNFVFSPDGKYLYGSSYYTGVSNIFRYDLATGALDAVSNTETGFFRPIPTGTDSLVVFRFTGAGFVPASIEARPLADVGAITFLGQQIAEEYPVVKQWVAESPAAIPLDALITRKRPYRSFKSMGLESVYPVVEGYKDFAAVGLHANFSDPVELNRASITASYSPSSRLAAKERYHLRGQFQRYDWKLGFQWNGADFYDLFGPTKTSLKGHAVNLGYRKILVYDKPRQLDLNFDVAYYGGLERLPNYQNVATDFDKVLETRAWLTYANQRHSLGFVDEEKGVKWDLAFLGDRVKGRSFPKVYSNLDLGFALPLRHSSVWLRSSAGYSPGDRDEPFANFYFGGFGNNYVDHGDEKRYRAWYSFPGLELNEVGGTNYVKSILEWNLPPIRFRRVGHPGFYLTWARPALFVSGLATNLDRSSLRRVVTNVGTQLDFRLSALSRLDLTFSVGYAVAFEDGARPRHETMVSLKLLR